MNTSGNIASAVGVLGGPLGRVILGPRPSAVSDGGATHLVAEIVVCRVAGVTEVVVSRVDRLDWARARTARLDLDVADGE